MFIFQRNTQITQYCLDIKNGASMVFRLDALALSVIDTERGWLGGWVAGCHTPVLYQNG